MADEPTSDPQTASRPALIPSVLGSQGRQAARRRLLNARGHLDAVARMLDEDRYCVDILHQLSAVEGAITRARRDITSGHIRGCVADALQDGVIGPGEVAGEVEATVFGGGVPAARTQQRAVR
jgi:CsoR family transcriptional regulator, copper-sensing transcriptional repressor